MTSRVYNEVEPTYANLCSNITLFSVNKGFFRELAENVLEMASNGDWLKTTFEQAGRDAGKIAAVLNNASVMEALGEVFSGIEPMYRKKDGKISQTKRLEAEKTLKDGNVMQALAIASQAVIMAPMKSDLELVDGGISLALALWTRSEILLQMGRPQAALVDLKQALKARLPPKMRADYYWRVGNCHRDVGEPVRAKVSFEVAARLLSHNEATKQLLLNEIADLDKVETITKPIRKKYTGASLSGGGKQSMPSLSRLVKITEEGNKGRFATASSPIQTGDVLLAESPYASCLRPDNHGSHCLHCFKSLAECEDEAPSWCPKCSGVAFCSTKCRDTAVNSYHKYECSLMDIFIGSGMSVLTHLALRMVTQAGLEGSIAIHEKYISNGIQTINSSAVNEIEGATKKSRMEIRRTRLDRRQKALKNNNKEENDDKHTEKKADEKVSFEETLELKSAQIYSLCTHSDLRGSEDYLKRVIMAMFLVRCLKKTTFFGQCSPEILKQHEQSILELLLKNLQILQFNAHEIYETLHGKHIFRTSKILYIAVGIYPTGALFNHECYPAVTRYFQGRDLILRAMRPLSPDDIVSENYGPHFLVRNLTQRQKALTCRYWFKCDCIACQENWPILKNMYSDAPITFKCLTEDCIGKIRANPIWPNQCPKCFRTINKRIMNNNMQNVKTCVKQYQEGARLMDEENPEEAINLMAPSIDDYHEVAMCPNKETHLAQESLRACFACSGNKRQVEST